MAQFPISAHPFRLTEADYREAIAVMRHLRVGGVRVWIETAILSVIAAGYVVDLCTGNVNWFSMGMLLICLVVIAGLWLIPYFSIRSMARDQVRAECFTAEIAEQEVTLKQGTEQWIVPLDETTIFRETDHLFLLETANHRSAVLLKSAFDGPEEVRVVLTAHTTVY